MTIKHAKRKRPSVRRLPRSTAPPQVLATALESGPSRDEIKPQVLAILNAVARPASRPVADEGKNLTDDHGITDTAKENLAPSFSRISRDKYHGLPVSRADSKACKLVGDSITLVWKRANNDATWKPK